MQKLPRLVVAASAAAVLAMSAGVALAQGTPSAGTAPAPTPAATSPAAPEAKAPENKAPENKAPENMAAEKKGAPKKKKPTRMTRQQEIDRSVDRGTVPARYRNSVPKEYHQYIPFDKQ
jgi:hypothetical protein